MKDKIDKLMKALTKREIISHYADNREEAISIIMDLIPESCLVGIGGSSTIDNLQLQESLHEKGCEILWHWQAKDREESMLIRHKALEADVYLCSTNAITVDGKLVNIDGTGNRVASMVFGPKKVVFAVGINKIVEDLEAAFQRVKGVACPLNAKRLKLNTPCALSGQCNDCESPDRMCKVTSIIEGKTKGVEMHVVIIGESLGY